MQNDQFIHRYHNNDSTLASLDARQLWHALVDLFIHKRPDLFFGGPLYSINMYPVNLKKRVGAMPFTFGHLVSSLAVEIDHVVQMADNASLLSGP